jgi:serine phosphatase RsbU (regulator of sigma subunit)
VIGIAAFPTRRHPVSSRAEVSVAEETKFDRDEAPRSLARHAGIGEELAGLVERRVHPLDAPGWRLLLVVAGGSIAGAIVHQVFGIGAAAGSWLYALLLGTAWYAAVRFLLLDTRARRFWTFWMAAATLLLLALGPNPYGRFFAIAASCIFLLIRKYRPYRQLSGSRRARIFLLGFLALVLLTLGGDFGTRSASELPWLHGLGVNLGRWASTSVYIFWLFSLLQIFFRMRLHFMRLKPKLAVSAMLIALVPLVLLVVFGIFFTFGILGGSRAARTNATFLDWARLAEQGDRLSPIPFGTGFTYGPAGARSAAVPPWIDSLVVRLDDGGIEAPAGAPAAADSAALGGERQPGVTISLPSGEEQAVRTLEEALALVLWAPADTTAYFRIGSEVWLLRLAGIGTPDLRIDGFALDEPALDHLSTLVGCDIGLLSTRNMVIGGEESAESIAARSDTTRREIHIQGRHGGVATADSSAGLWQRAIGFGGGMLQTLRLSERGLERDTIFYHLHIRLAGLAKEFTGQELIFNQAILLGLAVIAGLFLILEGFALFFGVRITAGILGAVRALHRGTVRLAGGDLNARISVPSDDELGDLASSFNVMTIAVRRGREEAVARERLERELETARDIQQRLLPAEVPAVPGFDITGTSLPSRQVGGDYFDFLSHGQDRLGIAIGDVSGKGIPAALLMSNLQASLQGQVIHPSSVAEVVARVNDLLARSTDAQMFATFFYGVLDCREATFTSSNAGHNPPILMRADGTVERLQRGGLVLGMLGSQNYEQETVCLAPGDSLVLFTDGISEAEGPVGVARAPASDDDDPDNPMFGEERLIEVVRVTAKRSAAEMKDAILRAVESFAAGVPQSDDVTLVIIKRPEA